MMNNWCVSLLPAMREGRAFLGSMKKRMFFVNSSKNMWQKNVPGWCRDKNKDRKGKKTRERIIRNNKRDAREYDNGGLRSWAELKLRLSTGQKGSRGVMVRPEMWICEYVNLWICSVSPQSILSHIVIISHLSLHQPLSPLPLSLMNLTLFSLLCTPFLFHTFTISYSSLSSLFPLDFHFLLFSSFFLVLLSLLPTGRAIEAIITVWSKREVSTSMHGSCVAVLSFSNSMGVSQGLHQHQQKKRKEKHTLINQTDHINSMRRIVRGSK